MSIDRLDFEVSELDPMGPQEFADAFSCGPVEGIVVPTRTLHCDAANGNVVLGVDIPESRGFIAVRDGLRVVACSPTYKINVVDMPTAPNDRQAATVTVTVLVPDPITNQLRVESVATQEFAATEHMTITAPAHGWIKVFNGTAAGGRQGGEPLWAIVDKLDETQRFEFSVSLEVMDLIGHVAIP